MNGKLQKSSSNPCQAQIQKFSKTHDLSPVGKIFEELLLTRLGDHVYNHEIIPFTQFGFRANHSTNLQLLMRLIDTITTEFNNKASTATDFNKKKAFDKTWHPRFLCKLADINIPGYLLEILSSYLTDRTFKVNYSIGVSKTRYARARLQRSLTQVSDWCKQWNIKINERNTQVIVFTKGRPREIPPIQLHGRILQYKSHVKYLGLMPDKSSTFKQHVHYFPSKSLQAFRRLIPIFKTPS